MMMGAPNNDFRTPQRGRNGFGFGPVLGLSIALIFVGIIAIVSTTYIFCTKVVIEDGERKRKFSFCHRCRKEKIADINLQ